MDKPTCQVADFGEKCSKQATHKFVPFSQTFEWYQCDAHTMTGSQKLGEKAGVLWN